MSQHTHVAPCLRQASRLTHLTLPDLHCVVQQHALANCGRSLSIRGSVRDNNGYASEERSHAQIAKCNPFLTSNQLRPAAVRVFAVTRVNNSRAAPAKGSRLQAGRTCSEMVSQHPLVAKLGSKPWSEVQALLRSSDFERQVRYRQSALHPDLYCLTYEQISADWKNPFTTECRGQQYFF